MKQSGSFQRSKESRDNPGKYFDEIRKESFEDTFPATEFWLRKTSTNLSNQKTERKFSHMKKYFAANKLKLAYTFLILAFVIAACNYPVVQEESAGDVLKWTVPAENTETINKIANMDWFKNGEFNYNSNVSDGKEILSYSFVVPKDDHAKANQYMQMLENAGVSTVEIVGINEPVKRPLYSAVLNNLFEININATNMSNEEVTAEVREQLRQAGIENPDISFETDKEGKRHLRLFIPENQLKKDGGFDMMIKDGNSVMKLKEVRKEGGPGEENKFKGKSDSEIKKMVMEDMKELGLTEDEIEVIREGDAVKIKVNKKDVKGNMKWETEDIQR